MQELQESAIQREQGVCINLIYQIKHINIDESVLCGKITGWLGQRVMHPRQPHILTLHPTDLQVLIGRGQQKRTLGISGIVTVINSIFI